jgi:hypothetical protein
MELMQQMNDQIPPETEIEPISPQQARTILYQAIREKLGDKWSDEETGWMLVSGHDFMARLTRGNRNIDFYVDLLGQVTVEEKELSPVQDGSRLLAWMFLFGSLAVALLIAYLTGAL